MGSQPRKPTAEGPREWFTGQAFIDSIVEPGGGSELNISIVHFTPAARTAWHSHAGGQTLYVLEGRGRVQNRGEAPVELRPGEVHQTPDGQEHWHGAHHEHLMSHISITQGPASWGEHVTEAEYGAE